MEKKARYQMSSYVNAGILEIVLTGELTNHNVEKIMKELVFLQKSMSTNYQLIDVRKIKGRLDFSEAHLFVKSLPSDKPKMNTAFVDSVENADYNSFYEIVAHNAGLSFKTFTDIDAARAWLKSKLKKGSGSSVRFQMSTSKSSIKPAEKFNEIIEVVNDVVMTSVFAGLGIAFLGEEAIEKWARKIAEENNLSTKDVKSFIRDVKKQGKEARKTFEKRIKKIIDEVVQSTKMKK